MRLIFIWKLLSKIVIASSVASMQRLHSRKEDMMTKGTGVKIVDDQYQKIKEIARREDRPIGTVMRRLLEKALADG